MSIPIFPAAPHPAGRPALRPSSSFPWPNYYPSAFITAELNIYDQLAHDAFVGQDVRRREDGLKFRATLAVPSVYKRSTTCADAGHCIELGSNEELAGEHATYAAEVNLFRNVPQAAPTPRDIPTVVFTHGLSVVKELHSPQDFLAEQDTLLMIADGSRFRHEYAVQRAEQLNAETYDAPTVGLFKRARVLRVLSGIRQRGKDALRRIFLLRSHAGTD
ncbi:hypothetical protein DFH09DRAFT_1309415 [Mycena vulgaris]|nr:hypothetical protein DFH09DRAFT_1309415 [Mycena vulgaris]